MPPHGNLDLESIILEPLPRSFGGRIYVRVRVFKTAGRASDAVNLIKRNGGLTRVVKTRTYGKLRHVLYANANGSRKARDAIADVSSKGKIWSDW